MHQMKQQTTVLSVRSSPELKQVETVNLVNFRDEAPLSSSPCCTRNTVVNRIDKTIRLSLTYFNLLTNSHGNYAVSQRIQLTLRTGHATLVVLPTIPRR